MRRMYGQLAAAHPRQDGRALKREFIYVYFVFMLVNIIAIYRWCR